MRRVLSTLSIVMLVLLIGWRWPAVRGQSSSGLTGPWNVTLSAPDGSITIPMLITFHGDGTVTAVFPGFGDGVGVGAWTQTGDGQFAMTTLHFDQNVPPTNNPLNGYLKVRASLTVSGNSLTGTAESIQTDLTGAVVKHATGIMVSASPIAVEEVGAP